MDKKEGKKNVLRVMDKKQNNYSVVAAGEAG